MEDAFVAESPSILDVAEKQLPREMLRWHYRSQNPDLIRFSNERFYDGRMVLFPSPRRNDQQEGVVFHLLGALCEFGKLGVVCVAGTLDRARALYEETTAILDREAGRASG